VPLCIKVIHQEEVLILLSELSVRMVSKGIRRGALGDFTAMAVRQSNVSCGYPLVVGDGERPGVDEVPPVISEFASRRPHHAAFRHNGASAGKCC
jgi:hypothetical protein